MYDILQLNDMLVPELKDIAEGLKIDNHHKLNKQELIYKILDKQAVAPEVSKTVTDEAKPKTRRRKVVTPAEEVTSKEPETVTSAEPIVETPASTVEEPPVTAEKTEQEKAEEAIRYEKNGQFQRLP